MIHQRPPLRQSVTASVGTFGIVADEMRECGLDDLARVFGFVGRPIAKGRAEPVRRDSGDVHAFEQRLEGHVGKRPTLQVRKDEVGGLGIVEAPVGQDLDSADRQRNAVLTLRFHARSGYRPKRRAEIEFAPDHSTDLAGAGCRKNNQLEHARGRAALLPKGRNEARQLRMGQGGVVRFGTLWHPRQDRVEMTAPSRRVLGRRVSASARSIQDALDAPAQALCGLGLFKPDRTKHSEHIVRTDCTHRLTPERLGLHGQRLPPLPPVRRVAPDRLSVGHVGLGDLTEGHNLWLSCRGSLSSTRCDRIDTLGDLLANFGRTVAGSCQWCGEHATKAHLTTLSGSSVVHGPAFGAGRVNDQVEAAAVAIAAWTGDRLHASGGQLVYLPGHPTHPTICPTTERLLSYTILYGFPLFREGLGVAFRPTLAWTAVLYGVIRLEGGYLLHQAALILQGNCPLDGVPPHHLSHRRIICYLAAAEARP